MVVGVAYRGQGSLEDLLVAERLADPLDGYRLAIGKHPKRYSLDFHFRGVATHGG
jgi:hypothetical protein